jgi:hypothetical protein
VPNQFSVSIAKTQDKSICREKRLLLAQSFGGFSPSFVGLVDLGPVLRQNIIVAAHGKTIHLI